MDVPPQRPVPSGKRPLWLRLIMAMSLLPFIAFFFLLALSLPAYFRSLSPLVLEAAAQGTRTPEAIAQQYLDRGQPGLAAVYLPFSENTEALQSALQAQMEANPLYRWSGGPAPFYEAFLDSAVVLQEAEATVLPTLLPEENREELMAFLRQSPNRNVQAILEARSLSGWQTFYPVFSTAGQPLDATLLTLALLEQSGHLPVNISESLRDDLVGAARGDAVALERAETVALSLLTLGRYYNWLQLGQLTERLSDLSDFLSATRFLQEDPSRSDLLLAAILMAQDVPALFAYLEQYGEAGWRGLGTSMELGAGAVEALVRFAKPLYAPPAFWEGLPPSLTGLQSHFKDLAEAYPSTTIGLRVLAFAVCGMLLVQILRVLLLHRPDKTSGRRLLLNLDTLTGGLLVTLFLWVAIEPGLLQFTPNEQGTLEINLAQVVPQINAEDSAPSSPDMLDQVTILILLLFLILQLLVFIFGLIKIVEVRRRKVPVETKLRLLDNEEVLFELGLYVGLGGTVASLILVVLNIVDASLMAAYASTLFGIIFVAILKVGFLRPYRRSLILESAQDRS